MASTIRTHTPDRRNPDGSTTIKMKRACNGCGQLLGDVDQHGNLTDVRAECPTCQWLAHLEAEGCTVRRLTERSYARIDHELDRDDVFTKQFTKSIDGKVTTVGMRIGNKPGHIVAYFGNWIIRHPDGHFTIHKAPNAA